ncbi:hypothetical protein RRG08_049270 [Elysia crispata]|uniref:Uncharacterized protein n=1 Tax=Elysia crispata TaxID=231223 RepID=A0AAE0ZP09_9GAST|nr:hypothetical protein RRG08_049270 [Elysia crispata]
MGSQVGRLRLSSAELATQGETRADERGWRKSPGDMKSCLEQFGRRDSQPYIDRNYAETWSSSVEETR